MPRPIIYFLLFLVALSLIPVGLVYKSRATRLRDQTRVQVVYDMDNQFYFKAQSRNPFFADDMAMRQPVEGTVARGQAWTDDPRDHGRVQGDTLFVDAFPVTVDRPLIDRGEERFNIYCAPCHGLSGDGNGLVHARAASLAEGTWTPPTDLGSQTVVDRPVGHLYNTIKNGIRNMPAYGSQIPVQDRWAIVAYVRALQLARTATIEDVPAAERATLGN
jgi:mono/diheme cytochrome c family protein